MTFLRLCTKQTCFSHICRTTFADQCNLLMNWLVNWQKINRKQIWFIPSVIYQAKMTNIHWFHHCFVNVHWISLHSGLVYGQNILFLPFFDNRWALRSHERHFPLFFLTAAEDDWGLRTFIQFCGQFCTNTWQIYFVYLECFLLCLLVLCLLIMGFVWGEILVKCSWGI